MDSHAETDSLRMSDRRLAWITTTAEFAARGVSDARIRTSVRRGVITQIDRGVYARADLAAKLATRRNGERLIRLAAALAVVGPSAVASHHDAALVHGLALLDQPSELLCATNPPGSARHRTSRTRILAKVAALPKDHVTVVSGIPVTSVARTVVDLARTTSFRSGVVVADSALCARKTGRGDLGAVLASCARWPGIHQARQVVEFADARSESPFESISRVAFRDGGLPAPDLQVWLGGDDGPIGRVDFLWRAYRTVAEADGALKYADPDRARLQLRRDARLRAAGFEVVHFSWQELVATPGQVMSAILAAFRRATAARAAAGR